MTNFQIGNINLEKNLDTMRFEGYFIGLNLGVFTVNENRTGFFNL